MAAANLKLSMELHSREIVVCLVM